LRIRSVAIAVALSGGAEQRPPYPVGNPAGQGRRRLRLAGGLDGRQLPVAPGHGHESPEPRRPDLGRVRIAAQVGIHRQRAPPLLPVARHPVPFATDLTQRAELVLVKG
jgi:hypothetical protein